MNADVLAILVAAAVVLIPLLVFAGWAIVAGVSGAIEARHRRRLEVLKAEAKLRREIEQEWDSKFNEVDG